MATDQARIRVARPGYRPDVLSIVGLLFVAAGAGRFYLARGNR